MSAREMFANLGYEYKEELTQCFYSKTCKEVIIFFKTSKTFLAKTMDNYLGNPLEISIQLNKAIQQQILELGWEE